MKNQLLYEFAVTDDQARSRAVTVSSLIAITTGCVLWICGLNDQVSMSATAIVTIISMSVFAYRYVASGAAQKSLSVTEPKRRTLLKIASIGLGESVASWSFRDTAWALSFADAALAKVRSNNYSASVPKLIYAKSILNFQVNHASPAALRRFQIAYASLDVAQAAARIKQGRHEAHISASNDFTVSEWILGGSRDSSVITFGGKSSGTTIRTRVNVGFVSLTWDGHLTFPVLPRLVESVSGAQAIFINCTIKYYAQSLSGLILVDVLFENCSLDIKSSKNLTLVNVSFRNCQVACDQEIATEIPGLSGGNLVGITYASWPK